MPKNYPIIASIMFATNTSHLITYHKISCVRFQTTNSFLTSEVICIYYHLFHDTRLSIYDIPLHLQLLSARASVPCFFFSMFVVFLFPVCCEHFYCLELLRVLSHRILRWAWYCFTSLKCISIAHFLWCNRFIKTRVELWKSKKCYQNKKS